MTVMRRNNGWAFAAWVADEARGRRQVWRGGFRTKADAAAAERRFLVELETAGEPARPSTTVEAFLTDWLVQSASTRRATTSMSYESVIATRLVPHLGHLDLRELAPAHIRELHTALLSTPLRRGSGLLSPTTVRMTHRVLRRAMQDALRWELVDRNPCDAVRWRACAGSTSTSTPGGSPFGRPGSSCTPRCRWRSRSRSAPAAWWRSTTGRSTRCGGTVRHRTANAEPPGRRGRTAATCSCERTADRWTRIASRTSSRVR